MTFAPAQPIALPPSAIALVLVDLAECVCAELEASGAGPTCWCGLYPGATVSWEYCGECSGDTCGMGYVRLAEIFPFNDFPTATIDLKCQSPLAWSVEVGALRCFPNPGDGTIASPQALTETTIAQALDAMALYRAIKCCEALRPAVGNYVPVGPGGGCVGGFWTAYSEVDNA